VFYFLILVVVEELIHMALCRVLK